MSSARDVKLDPRLLRGLTVTADELIDVCSEHWSGPAGDQPCRRCSVVICPSLRTAHQLVRRRWAEAAPRHLAWLQLSKPLTTPTARRPEPPAQAEELFDSAPFVDHSPKRRTRRRSSR